MNLASISIRKIVFIAAAVTFLGAFFLATRLSSVVNPHGPLPTHAFVFGHVWSLEIANTEALRSLGLGERDSYPDDRGMLFLFTVPDRYGFWMKGMRFPLDMVFLDRGKIVFIERGIRPDDPKIVTPPVPADQVLELYAGGAEDLLVGDRIWYWQGF